MKIIKRLSIHASMYRGNDFNGSSSLVKRWMERKQREKDMHVEEELWKYGYCGQNNWINRYYIIGALASVFGIFCYFYMHQLYRNEMRSRHPYRVQQRQHGSIKLYSRLLLLNINQYIDRNFFIMQFFDRNDRSKIHPKSEALLRYGQYQNYQKHRNKTFEFMDIGLLNQYPYPDISSAPIG